MHRPARWTRTIRHLATYCATLAGNRRTKAPPNDPGCAQPENAQTLKTLACKGWPSPRRFTRTLGSAAVYFERHCEKNYILTQIYRDSDCKGNDVGSALQATGFKPNWPAHGHLPLCCRAVTKCDYFMESPFFF